MRLDKGFCAEGEVVVHGATVCGELNMSSAKLSNPHAVALNADRAAIEGGLNAGDGFVACGEVSLGGAHIGGSLDLGGASLLNPGGRALLADSLNVAGSFYCAPASLPRGRCASSTPESVLAYISREPGFPSPGDERSVLWE